MHAVWRVGDGHPSSAAAFRTTFLGEEITRFTGVLGLGDEDVSPEQGQQMPQYVLEEVLRDVVAELPTVDLRLGWRVAKVGEPGPGPVQVGYALREVLSTT